MRDQSLERRDDSVHDLLLSVPGPHPAVAQTSAANAGQWDGLGGKLSSGETPLDCVRRELLKEAEIDLRQFGSSRFAGVVTWKSGVDPAGPSTGMYAFVAEMPEDWPVWEGEEEVEEGLLAWKPFGWVCDPHNEDASATFHAFSPSYWSAPSRWCTAARTRVIA